MEATVIALMFGRVEVHFKQDEHGVGWAPGEEIGLALEYSKPRVAIDKLFQRHRDILDAPEYSAVPKMVTASGTQTTRNYSEEGAYLLGLYSRQPKAREFQRRVVRFLATRRKKLIAAQEGKIAQMEKALDPDRMKLLKECWDWEHKVSLAELEIKYQERKVKFQENRNKIYWEALTAYPNQRALEWAHVERVRDNGLLPMKQIWWSPGGRVLKMSFHVIRQEV